MTKISAHYIMAKRYCTLRKEIQRLEELIDQQIEEVHEREKEMEAIHSLLKNGESTL